jgi:cytochrome c oxidase cbb3-type subunit 2
MKNGPLFFIGLFLALMVSWGGYVLASHAQLGSLTPHFDDGEGQAYPLRAAGIASRGQLVYADLGCAACHTQQVRRPGFGSDQERGWGERQNVARDYIFQLRPQLGGSRLGPDLGNFAGHKNPMDAEDVLKFLYTGSATHPSYKFLFADREIVGERATQALKFTGAQATPAGREIVPTERARTLAAYLTSLNTAYTYPEARPVPAKKGAAPAGHAAPAPDTKKQAGAEKK